MNELSAQPAPGVHRWSFGSYSEYARYQFWRSARTRGLTRGYGEIRQRLAAMLRAHAPQVDSLLCLGARSRVEVEHFQRLGFTAEGLDLSEDGPVGRGDMADLASGDGRYARPFDAFLACQSLDHCWDLDRFRRCSLPFCRTAIAVAVSRPIERPSRWRCVDLGVRGVENDAAVLDSLLPGFRTVHREILSNACLFILLRNNSTKKETRAPTNRAKGLWKNVMVANHVDGAKHDQADWERLLRAQIDNSLEVGWSSEDIVIVTNFPFSYRGVSAIEETLNRHCLRGSKMFAIHKLLRRDWPTETVLWAHDLDCWQNLWFDVPDFADVGATEYSLPKFNGGSVCWRPQARDIAAEIVRRLQANVADREEPTLDEVFRSDVYRERVTVLNATYNVGCSGYHERIERSDMPVRASHFHPTNRLAWERHVLNRDGLAVRSASRRLEAVIRKWFPELPTTIRASKTKAKRR